MSRAAPSILASGLALLMAGCGAPEAAPEANRAANARESLAVPVQNLSGPAQNTAHEVAPSTKPTPARTPPPARPAPSPAAYRAIGTEPFWAVTVRGSVAVLERPDKAPLRFPVTRSDDGRAVRWLGEGFAMTAAEGPCGDGMSDAVWSDRVQVAFAGGTLKGCGGVNLTMGEDRR